MNGNKYDVKEGMWDEAAQRWIFPGGGNQLPVHQPIDYFGVLMIVLVPGAMQSYFRNPAAIA
jgi:hypothetical protein